MEGYCLFTVSLSMDHRLVDEELHKGNNQRPQRHKPASNGPSSGYVLLDYSPANAECETPETEEHQYEQDNSVPNDAFHKMNAPIEAFLIEWPSRARRNSSSPFRATPAYVKTDASMFRVVEEVRHDLLADRW